MTKNLASSFTGMGGEKKNGKKAERDKVSMHEECIVRVHQRSRRKLFTPPDVKTYDSLHESDFGGLRVTKGVCEVGSSFCVKDFWLNLRRAHHVMAKPWTGVSVLMAVAMRPESGESVRGGVSKA